MTQRSSHPIPALRIALDRARPGLSDIAAAANIPHATMDAYHVGIRRAPPAVCRRVADFLRAKAEEFGGLADALETATERDPGPVPVAPGATVVR